MDGVMTIPDFNRLFIVNEVKNPDIYDLSLMK